VRHAIGSGIGAHHGEGSSDTRDINTAYSKRVPDTCRAVPDTARNVSGTIAQWRFDDGPVSSSWLPRAQLRSNASRRKPTRSAQRERKQSRESNPRACVSASSLPDLAFESLDDRVTPHKSFNVTRARSISERRAAAAEFRRRLAEARANALEIME
jgi:hypothetical protein